MDVVELRLKERTALVVGPLNRAHQSIAHKLTQLGADVVLAAPEKDQAQRLASQILEGREIQERYGRAGAVALTAKSLDEARDMVSRAAELFGGIDILIESGPVVPARQFADDTLADLDSILDRATAATMYTTHAVLPFLKGRKRGRIVYLLHEWYQGLEGGAVLATARSGLLQFAKTLAREVCAQNITVNCVIQGLSEDFLLASQQAASAQAAIEELRKRFPRAQFTDPERIADVVTFLVSAMGAGVSGQPIAVRNGLALTD